MKIKTLKKILKRANTTKVITLKDNNPNSLTKGMYFMINYVPECENLKYDRFGVTITNKIVNCIAKSFPYYMVVKIE